MAGSWSKTWTKVRQTFTSKANASQTDDEDGKEGIASYRPGSFHPVRLGELYGSKYEVLRKLGYGQYSTVWLVRNREDRTFWAMKVLSAECYGTDSDIVELDILEHLRRHGSAHPGSRHITMLEDSFEHKGPNGTHMCLIFKVMGESMSTFQKSFPQAQTPSPLIQRFATQLLQAIDCAHECGVIHTDIQPGNIMLRNPDETALTKYLEETYADADNPSEVFGPYKIIPSKGLRQHYLGNTRGFNLLTLEVSLADWGVACWKEKHLSETIQPPLLRAPEVILQAPWGAAVDIWNLGSLLPELMFGQNMFSGRDSGEYTVRVHLAEINVLLGPIPQSLLSTANLEGAREMFDEHGNVRKYRLKKVVPLKQRLEDLPDDEAPKFEAFTRRVLELDPPRRPSAGKMLDDPWISHEYTQSISAEKVS